MLIFGKEKVGSNGAQGNPAKAVGTGILREFMCNEPTGPVCVSNPFKRGYGLRKAKWGCRTFFLSRFDHEGEGMAGNGFLSGSQDLLD